VAFLGAMEEIDMTPLARIELAQDLFRFAYLVGSPISFGLPATAATRGCSVAANARSTGRSTVILSCIGLLTPMRG
jgi:hypothetical protein